MEALNNLLQSPVLGWAVVIIILALIIPVYWSIRHRQQGNSWQDVAAQHGLTFIPGEKLIKGTYQGQSVSMDVHYPPTSNHKVFPMTRIVVSLKNPVDGYLNAAIGYGIADNQLVEANEFAKRRGMNMTYVHTGDKDIDRKVTMSAPSGEFAAKLLTKDTAVRDVILRKGSSGTITLEGQQLRYEWSGIETKSDKLQSGLDLITRVAEIVARI